MVKINKKDHWTTELPLTAQAKEAFLDKYFASDLPNYGELFIPGDDFYINQPPALQADHMTSQLCRWLGIKPGYIGLEFESLTGDVPDGQRHTIFIEEAVLNNEFLLGEALAYSLTRYLLEDRKQIMLPSDQQPALIATASVVFGMGLVMLNGMVPGNGWLDKLKIRKQPRSVHFSAYPEASWINLIRGFIQHHGINPQSFRHTLAPWATQKLHLTPSVHPSHVVLHAKYQLRLSAYKLLALTWLTILIMGIGIFTMFMRVKPVPTNLVQAQEQVNLLTELNRQCQESLSYNRQYADTTDIETVRALNAESVRCESLHNQANAAQQELTQATGQ